MSAQIDKYVAEVRNDVKALLRFMEAADAAVGQVWEYLDPRVNKEGGTSPSSELAEPEILAEFFSQAVLFLRVMRATGESVVKGLSVQKGSQDLIEDTEQEQDHEIYPIRDIQLLLESIGLSFSADVIRSWTAKEVEQAEDFILALQHGEVVPKPAFLT